MSSRSHYATLLGVGLVLFFVNLGGIDLWPPDEPRFAEVTREMLLSGDYLVPRVNGSPYNEKPPLLFWTQAITAHALGGMSEVAARVPSAVSGILVVLMTYFLGSRLFDKRTAFWAAMILATTQRFWWQTRFGQIDMLLTACVTASFCFLWLWHSERKDRFLVAFYIAIGAGMLAKGPPALLFPLLASVAFYWKNPDDRKKLHLASGMVFSAMFVLAWVIPARTGISVEEVSTPASSILENLNRQTFGRFFQGVSHANPPWYYLVNLPLELLPWSLFLPWSVRWATKTKLKDESERFLVCWIVPAFIFFTICVEKRSLYLLPIYPAIAILLSKSILALEEPDCVLWRKSIVSVWAVILVIVGVGLFGVRYTAYAHLWDLSYLMLSLVVLCGAMWTLVSIVLSECKNAQLFVFTQAATLFVGIAVVVFPTINEFKSAKSFCEPIRVVNQSDPSLEVYSLAFSREEFVYYSEHFHEVVPPPALLGQDEPERGYDQRMQLQKNFIRKMAKAVESYPHLDLSNLTNAQLNELSTLFEKEFESWDSYPSHRKTLEAYFSNLVARTSDDEAIFIIAKRVDWLWLLVLCPELGEFHIVRDEGVGSRELLLLANSAGEKAWKSGCTVNARAQLPVRQEVQR